MLINGQDVEGDKMAQQNKQQPGLDLSNLDASIKRSGFIRESLATRVQFLVGLVLFLILVLAMSITLIILTGSFRSFEKREMAQKMSRILLLFERETSNLRSTTLDYAHWDDMEMFLRTKEPSFLRKNFPPETFANIDVDIVLILDERKQPLFFKQISMTDKSKLSSGSGHFLEKIRSGSILEKLDPITSSTLVSFLIDGETHLLSGSRILTSDKHLSSVGWLVMAKKLTSERLERYKSIAGQDFILLTDLSQISKKSFYLKKGRLVSEHLVKDGKGNGLYLLRVNSGPILNSQYTTIVILIFLNLLILMLAGLLVLRSVLSRLVLSRIKEFSIRTTHIRKNPENPIRLPHSGSDELDVLAMGMNELLNELDSIRNHIRFDALHDPLTKLGNRSLLMDRLSFIHSITQRDANQKFAIFMIDLDGFKEINDTFGHDVGDLVLKETARRFMETIRKSDTVVRLGGDEFIILQLGVQETADLEKFATKLLGLIREPIYYMEQELRLSASIGIFQSIQRCGSCAPSDYLRDVDMAMYMAKKGGKNQHYLFSCTMRGSSTYNIAMMTDLRKSIQENRMEVWYQPIIDTHSGHLKGLEALLRWNHPEKGLISPEIFIPLAEEANLIVKVDQWALMMVLDHMYKIRQINPSLYVSVNFSVKHFLHPNMHKMLMKAIDAASLPLDNLVIEITESAIAKDISLISENVEKVRSSGIRLFLDDFGTGYSSLDRLQHLPFHAIKIDKSFVRRLENNDLSIVEAIIHMGHSLDKKVIAEGVETEKQRDFLKSLGCDYLQGFLYSRPLPLEDILKFIARYK